MRLILHDTLATAPFVYPLTAGWVTAETPAEPRSALRAADISAEDVALISSAEIALLQETHVVVPDIALVSDQIGMVAMRTPVRPDEVRPTPIRLWETSGSAELLARATIEPFYGILPTEWTTEDTATATVVIVEGATAVQSPEAGFAEDLVRAWFILTGQPFVSHLLVAPIGLDREALAPAVTTLTSALEASHERRRDLRRALAEQYDLERERLAALFNAQRHRLDDDDRRALLMLLQKGNRGSAYPYPWTVPYLEEASSGEDGAA